MTVAELLNHFEDENLYVGMCMPSIRNCGSIKKMMDPSNSFFFNLTVLSWKLTDKIWKIIIKNKRNLKELLYETKRTLCN